jgi:CRP-like cAMP-binding protein
MRMATVSPTIKSQLLSVAPVFKEPKGAVLFRRNEPAFGIFLICKGSVSLRLEAEDGTSGWDRTAMSDSIVGLAGTLSGNRYSLTAVVSEDAELAFLGRGIVLDLIKNDANVGLGLMQTLAEEIVQARAVLSTTSSSLLSEPASN